jgi:hypothetical protein
MNSVIIEHNDSTSLLKKGDIAHDPEWFPLLHALITDPYKVHIATILPSAP